MTVRSDSQFARNVVSYAGALGERWLRDLPRRIEELANHWQLTDITPFENLSFNFVGHAMRAGESVVLKVSWDNAAIQREHSWLCHYAKYTKNMVVPVLSTTEQDAYLMTKLIPGTALNRHDEERATEVLGRCIRALNEVVAPMSDEDLFPSTAVWFSQLQVAGDASKQALGEHIDRAYAISRELLQSTDMRLLHGDLHHANVIRHGDHWLITDPHGVMGDPAHECAAMLRNALHGLHDGIANGVQRRVSQLAATTGLEAEKISAWGYAQNVLSCVWSLDADPNADIAPVMAVVDALYSN
ncbi:MAG: aminoglycoside phosphotransferase family protein [Pseudomonadaceae bacterium]|nr:aminoglycoside phosphotransferase family protein [Pseudomonadaceae bacterium]